MSAPVGLHKVEDRVRCFSELNVTSAQFVGNVNGDIAGPSLLKTTMRELLIDHRERAGGFSEAFAQDEVRLILQLAAPKIVHQSDRLVSELPHVPRLRLPCAVGWFLLHVDLLRRLSLQPSCRDQRR